MIQNAFNLNAMIQPTTLANGDVANRLECGTIKCDIPNVDSVCTLDNIKQPGGECINKDGPGLVNTPGIDLFQKACSNVYVQSNDSAGNVFSCNTGTLYDVVFCP